MMVRQTARMMEGDREGRPYYTRVQRAEQYGTGDPRGRPPSSWIALAVQKVGHTQVENSVGWS